MDRKMDIIMALERSLDESIGFFRSLTPEQLNRPVYADDLQWSARQILTHFVTIEKSMQNLFVSMLEGGAGATGDFDIDRYNQSQVPKLDPLTLDELIERFRAVRERTIDIVSGLNEADLDRSGVHPYLGNGTMERFIRWAYEHAGLHEADIRKALQLRPFE